LQLTVFEKGRKSTWWMPRRQEPTKGVAGYEKPRGAASEL